MKSLRFKQLCAVMLCLGTLSFAGEVTPPLPTADRFPVTEAQQQTFKSISDMVSSANKVYDEADLAYYRAKEVRDKAIERNNATQGDINAKIAAMKAEIKCQDCYVDQTGKFWVKPPAPTPPVTAEADPKKKK